MCAKTVLPKLSFLDLAVRLMDEYGVAPSPSSYRCSRANTSVMRENSAKDGGDCTISIPIMQIGRG